MIDVGNEFEILNRIDIVRWGEGKDVADIPRVWLNSFARRSRAPAYLKSNSIQTVADLQSLNLDVLPDCTRKEVEEIQRLSYSEDFLKTHIQAKSYKSLAEYVLAAFKLMNGGGAAREDDIRLLKTTIGVLDCERYWTYDDLAREMGVTRQNVWLLHKSLRSRMFYETCGDEVYYDFKTYVEGLFKQKNWTLAAEELAATVDCYFGWEKSSAWSVFNLATAIGLQIDRLDSRASDLDKLMMKTEDWMRRCALFEEVVNGATSREMLEYNHIKAQFIRKQESELSYEEYCVFVQYLLRDGVGKSRQLKNLSEVFCGKDGVMKKRSVVLRALRQAHDNGQIAWTLSEIIALCGSEISEKDFKSMIQGGPLDDCGCELICYGSARSEGARGKPKSTYSLSEFFTQYREVIVEAAEELCDYIKQTGWYAISLDGVWERYQDRAAGMPKQCAYWLMRKMANDIVLCSNYPYLTMAGRQSVSQEDVANEIRKHFYANESVGYEEVRKFMAESLLCNANPQNLNGNFPCHDGRIWLNASRP